MLAMGIRYLTGYAVATDVSNRIAAEWPPHPARIFMAMVAAHFETGQDANERAALEWLERQDPPAMYVPVGEAREVVTHYVPVNDTSNPVKNSKALVPLQNIPIGRDRQPRQFPRTHLQDDTAYLVWRDAAPGVGCLSALERVCGKVIRIGHSSSLVQMWVPAHDPPSATIEPALNGVYRLRVPVEGTLDYLAAQYSSGGSLARRPSISTWQPYQHRRGSPPLSDDLQSDSFDSEIMVLAIDEGSVVGLETTWRFLTALRNVILSTCDPVPEWISGHRPDRSPSLEPHLAFVPLPFVGHPHADGHLMGVGLAFPRSIPPHERGQALRKMLYDDRGLTRSVKVRLGSLGEWTLVRERRDTPPLTLQAESWTAASDTWTTVTPIVLDRHPKVDRVKDRERWSREIAGIIAESCERQGLPAPVAVDVDKTSWSLGAPRAIPGNGGGYPLMPVKEGQSARQQTHAWLRFDRKISGPLILGAGRYRGYGLCKPWVVSP